MTSRDGSRRTASIAVQRPVRPPPITSRSVRARPARVGVRGGAPGRSVQNTRCSASRSAESTLADDGARVTDAPQPASTTALAASQARWTTAPRSASGAARARVPHRRRVAVDRDGDGRDAAVELRVDHGAGHERRARVDEPGVLGAHDEDCRAGHRAGRRVPREHDAVHEHPAVHRRAAELVARADEVGDEPRARAAGTGRPGESTCCTRPCPSPRCGRPSTWPPPGRA